MLIHISYNSFTWKKRAVGSLVVRASDSRPEDLGSIPDATKHPPSTHGFTCRKCGGGDRGRVAIYRTFGELRRAKILLSPVWCSRPTTGVPLAHATMDFVGLDLTTSDRWHQKTTTTWKKQQKSIIYNFPKRKTDAVKYTTIGIFQRSESLHSLRYTKCLGDGDARAYKAVNEMQPYGDMGIRNLKCVGYVDKWMGTRLRALKLKMKGTLKTEILESIAFYNQGNITKSHALATLCILPDFYTARAMETANRERLRKLDYDTLQNS
ncbi:hypothetical protein TNCV_1837541 [Trichonephila clavipes]|nr:hypothetical protein TNCV_1837541 [Trichonephila clavipes]